MTNPRATTPLEPIRHLETPTPEAMHLEEDLDDLRKRLSQNGPGIYRSQGVSMFEDPMCCLCVNSEFTIRPKENQQYASTGKDEVSCCFFIPWSGSTYAGHMLEDGTFWTQKHSDGATATGNLTRADQKSQRATCEA